MSNKTIIYDSINNFLAKFSKVSEQMPYAQYVVKDWIKAIRQYEDYANNIDSNKPLENYNSMAYLVKRLYIMTTGKQFRHKSLMGVNNRQLLTNLTNSAIILLFMTNFREHFADVLNIRMMTPHVPNLTRGVDEILNMWQDFNLPQYTVWPPYYVAWLRDKTLFTTDVKEKFMNENYGLLKLLLASQYSEIRWNSVQKIEAVQTIFSNITPQDGEVDIVLLLKIFRFLTKHNSVLLLNDDNRGIKRREMKIIKSIANNNMLDQLKTMPESVWDSVVTTAISGRKLSNKLK